MKKRFIMFPVLIFCFALAAGCKLFQEENQPATLSSLVVSADDITLELDTQFRQHNLEGNYPVDVLQFYIAAENPEHRLQAGDQAAGDGFLTLLVPLDPAANTITITIWQGEILIGRYTITCYRKPAYADTWVAMHYTHDELGVLDILAKIREQDYDFYYYGIEGDPAILPGSRQGGFLYPRENNVIFLNQRYFHNGQIWEAYETIEYASYALDADKNTLRINFKSNVQEPNWKFNFVLQRRNRFYLGFTE